MEKQKQQLTEQKPNISAVRRETFLLGLLCLTPAYCGFPLCVRSLSVPSSCATGDGYDAQKSVYVEKLKDLKKKGEGASYRSAEKAGRANGIAALKTSCDEYKKWLVAR